jgi:predicted metal-dependent HD superfamily phosphohydrolase
MNEELLAAAESFAVDYLAENLPDEYVYHDLEHTRQVVASCKELALAYQLSAAETEVLLLAAWFHDLGYVKGPETHEQRGAAMARAFLEKEGYAPEKMAMVEACILATQVPQSPTDLKEQIICDADLSHLGTDSYWDRCRRVRQEHMVVKDIIFSEDEWLDFEINFMENQNFHTAVARETYGKKKSKHLKQLKKLKSQLFPSGPDGEPSKKQKKKRKKLQLLHSELEIKELKLGRGVETMYRTTYRTHVNLSSIADNKANLMLSVNAIVVSIVISSLVPKLADDPKLLPPTAILVAFSVLSIVFATLATRPKITKGQVTKEDILQKKGNLLFFGNFYNMSLDDYHWGMTEMIKDSDYLYSSMTRDLYFLGVVLAKKYRYLRLCYGVFMWGIIVSVLAFALAFLL